MPSWETVRQKSVIIRIGSSYFLIVSGFVIMPQKVVKALPCPTFLTVR